MAYQRVIPRDLFNESNLLFALGRLALHAHEYGLPEPWEVMHIFEDMPFCIMQDETNGGIYCNNVFLREKKHGTCAMLWRPLNNRSRTLLYLTTPECEDIEVLDESGYVTKEFH